MPVDQLDTREASTYLAIEVTELVTLASDLRQRSAECKTLAARLCPSMQERMTALAAELDELSRTASAVATDCAATLKEC